MGRFAVRKDVRQAGCVGSQALGWAVHVRHATALRLPAQCKQQDQRGTAQHTRQLPPPDGHRVQCCPAHALPCPAQLSARVPATTSVSRISSALAPALAYPSAISVGCSPSRSSDSALASSSPANDSTYGQASSEP